MHIKHLIYHIEYMCVEFFSNQTKQIQEMKKGNNQNISRN